MLRKELPIQNLTDLPKSEQKEIMEDIDVSFIRGIENGFECLIHHLGTEWSLTETPNRGYFVLIIHEKLFSFTILIWFVSFSAFYLLNFTLCNPWKYKHSIIVFAGRVCIYNVVFRLCHSMETIGVTPDRSINKQNKIWVFLYVLVICGFVTGYAPCFLKNVIKKRYDRLHSG